mmetsp:Transcript_62236/g.181770  ORF Transcript_62236/g.181770 Transcript_62236/m.181770 type:complete len:301 (+) Transcript_62236:1475-2377(+)
MVREHGPPPRKRDGQELASEPPEEGHGLGGAAPGGLATGVLQARCGRCRGEHAGRGGRGAAAGGAAVHDPQAALAREHRGDEHRGALRVVRWHGPPLAGGRGEGRHPEAPEEDPRLGVLATARPPAAVRGARNPRRPGGRARAGGAAAGAGAAPRAARVPGDHGRRGAEGVVRGPGPPRGQGPEAPGAPGAPEEGARLAGPGARGAPGGVRGPRGARQGGRGARGGGAAAVPAQQARPERVHRGLRHRRPRRVVPGHGAPAGPGHQEEGAAEAPQEGHDVGGITAGRAQEAVRGVAGAPT